MVVAAGLLLAVSFFVTWALGAFVTLVGWRFTSGSWVVWGTDALVSILLVAPLFGAIYRTLPARRIGWRTVWVGALATAVLFTLGKSLVALIVSGVSWTSYFGPGASLVAFLGWLYLSTQLFFVGAEFTEVWARRETLFSASNSSPKETRA